MNLLPLEDWLILRTKFYGIVTGERDKRVNASDGTDYKDCVLEAFVRHVLARQDELEAKIAALESPKAKAGK